MLRILLTIIALITLCVLLWFCVGRDAPRIESELAATSSRALSDAQLGWADVKMDGRELMLAGVAPDAAARDRAAELAKGVFGVRTIDNRITLTGTPSAVVAPTAASPGAYFTRVTRDASGVRLIGFVPDEGARQELVQRAETLAGDERVDDSLSVVPGAPEGWQRTVGAAMDELQDLDSGTVMLVGKDLNLSGRAGSIAARDGAQNDLRAALPPGYNASFDISVPPSPYSTFATFRGGRVSLTGLAPDEESRKRLVASARTRLGAQRVDDHLVVIPGGRKGWTPALELGLEQLSRFDEGTLKLADTNLSMSGRVSSPEIRDEVQRALEAGLPRGYAGSDTIEIAGEAGAPGLPVVASTPVPVSSPVPVPAPAPQAQQAARACADEFNRLLSSTRILFATGSAAIDRGSFGLLDELADIASGCPSARIQIAGHTDSQGSDNNNVRLSEARAEEVMSYLVRRGVDGARLSAVGYGESSPIADNGTAAGRSRNRRIEFNVRGEGE